MIDPQERVIAMTTSEALETVKQVLMARARDITRDAALAALDVLAAAVESAAAELADMEASFDLRWKADMRAIKQWREATGREFVLPDCVDLCAWLMSQVEQARAEIAAQEIAAAARSARIAELEKITAGDQITMSRYKHERDGVFARIAELQGALGDAIESLRQIALPSTIRLANDIKAVLDRGGAK